jgi:hypothetical protein
MRRTIQSSPRAQRRLIITRMTALLAALRQFGGMTINRRMRQPPRPEVSARIETLATWIVTEGH